MLLLLPVCDEYIFKAFAEGVVRECTPYSMPSCVHEAVYSIEIYTHQVQCIMQHSFEIGIAVQSKRSLHTSPHSLETNRTPVVVSDQS